MESLLQDLRYAARTLAKSPGFTAVTMLTLALGIGASVAMFSVLDGVLVRGAGFPTPERLVSVGSLPPEARDRAAPDASGSTSPLSAFDTWRNATDVVEVAGAAIGDAPVLAGARDARRVEAWSVTSSFFQLVGGRAQLGRLLDAADDSIGAPRVAVLSHDLWRATYGADASVIRRTIRLDTLDYVVVGVAAAGLRYPDRAQVWIGMGGTLSGPRGATLRQQWGAQVILRLRPGVGPARAQASLDRVTRAATASGTIRRALLPVVRPLSLVLEGTLRTPLVVLTAAVAALLLIAAINVAALLVARGLARAPELAVRAALGATRARVARLVVAEAVVLSFGGAASGVGLASWGVPALKALAGGQIPGIYQITVDGAALLAAVGIALLVGGATGLAPALLATQRSHADLQIGRHASEPGARRRTLDLLLGTQVCLTVVLVAGASLLGRTLARLESVNLGFPADRVVAADLWLPEHRYPDRASRVAFATTLRERLRHLPGVRAAGVATGIPFGGGDLTSEVAVAGRAVTDQLTWIAAVTDGYFESLEVPILRGTQDLSDAGAIVIDSTAARTFFPGREPLGSRLTYEGTLVGTVVGVAGDVHQDQVRGRPAPHIYAAYGAYARPYLHVVARGTIPPGVLAKEIRSAIHDIDPLQPIDQLGVLRERVWASFARERFMGALLGLFAVLSLALATSGLYGAVSYAVARRRREMAVRIAIGATGHDVVAALLWRTLSVVGAGLACGVVAALVASRILTDILYGVSRADPVSFAFVIGATLAVVVAATWFPAREAMRVDPVATLRAE